MRFVDKPTSVKVHVNPPRIKKPMTLKEYLFKLPNYKLAEYLIIPYSADKYEYDDDDDYNGAMYYCGTDIWYTTTDGKEFLEDEYEDAIKHQTELLASEYVDEDAEEEETNDEN